MVVVFKRNPEDEDVKIYVLTQFAAKKIEDDLKEDPMPVYTAGWHGFALIRNEASGTYELRLYMEDAWNRDWCNIHNRVYGPLLISGACWRETWNGKEYILPEAVARRIHERTQRENLLLDLESRIEDMFEWDEQQFAEAGLTKDGLLSNETLMNRIADRADDLQDSNVAYNVTLETAVRQILAELVSERGGDEA